MGPLLGGPRVLSQCILTVFPSYVFKGRLQGEPPQKKEEHSLHSKSYIEGKMGTGWVGRE